MSLHVTSSAPDSSHCLLSAQAWVSAHSVSAHLISPEPAAHCALLRPLRLAQTEARAAIASPSEAAAVTAAEERRQLAGLDDSCYELGDRGGLGQAQTSHHSHHHHHHQITASSSSHRIITLTHHCPWLWSWPPYAFWLRSLERELQHMPRTALISNGK